MTDALIDKIDSLLPQTQCELCEYPGCRPYATAIVEQGQSIDRCLPGGVRVLEELGSLLQQDITTMLPAMEKKQKPAMLAKIRESECIGCTKCIQACPVDAIIGASKQMHVVLTDICNGCELCVSPCPVDCIDLESIAPRSIAEEKRLAEQSREWYLKKKSRLAQQHRSSSKQHQHAKLAGGGQTLSARQQAIQEALARVQQKKGK